MVTVDPPSSEAGGPRPRWWRRHQRGAADDRLQLRAAEARYQALAESAIEAIVTADAGGVIGYANTAAHQMFGHAPGLLIGQPLTVLIPDRYHAGHLAGVARVLATGESPLLGRVLSLSGQRSDGSEFPVELMLDVWPAGSPTRFSAMLRDITEQGAAQERDELVADSLRAASAAPDLQSSVRQLAETLERGIRFDRLSYAVATQDDEFSICSVWGPDADRLPKGATLRLGAAGRTVAYRRDGRVCRADTSQTASGELPLDAMDEEMAGRGVRSYISVPVVVRERIVALVNVASTSAGAFSDDQADLVARVVGESSGVLHTLHLLERERDVGQRLRELDQLKSDFVAMVVHDLRSPMTVIGGYADTLRDHWPSLGDPQKLELLSTISRNVARLSELVEDIMQVVRLESGEVSPLLQPIDLGALVDRTLDEMRVAHPDHRWVSRLDPALADCHVEVDATHQWQILTNLLSNAAKFSPTGSVVRVELERVDEGLRVAVRDQGPGIRREDIPKLFQRFSRVAQLAPGARVKGTGLGLYICRLLVESQGGTIMAESHEGEGACFTYTVPARPVPVAAPALEVSA